MMYGITDTFFKVIRVYKHMENILLFFGMFDAHISLESIFCWLAFEWSYNDAFLSCQCANFVSSAAAKLGQHVKGFIVDT